MWNKAQSNIRPQDVDETSSASTVYVRRNIVYHERNDSHDAYYEWEEEEVPKEYWNIYQRVMELEHEVAELESLVDSNVTG